LIEWIIGKLNCRSGIHDWSPEDLNEVTQGHMEAGDEATLRCARCNKQVVTIEKLPDGSIKWTAHVKEAIIYEVSPDYINKHGKSHDFNKFQEDNK